MDRDTRDGLWEDEDLPSLGIIGSGNIGAGIARLAVAADIAVSIANSRGPKSLAGLVQELWAPERLSSAGIGPDEGHFDDALNAITAAGVV